MDNQNKPLKKILHIAIMGIISTHTAHAGAFYLPTEASAVSVGNYAAGAAAEAVDASTSWYNPAGLVLLNKEQGLVSGVGVFPNLHLSGTSIFNAFPAPYEQNFENLNGGTTGFIPAFYYALPLSDKVAFGLSLVAPFGLGSEWANNSPVRYQATFSEIITSDFSPDLAVKVNDNFSFGVGIDLQFSRVKLNSMFGLPTIYNAIGLDPATADTLTYNKASSFGVGYHLGIMGMFNDNHTRIGLAYMSKMDQNFHGYSQLQGPLANGGNIFTGLTESTRRVGTLNSSEINLPDVVNLSGYQDINDKFAILGSVLYTGWRTFKDLEFFNVAAPFIELNGNVTPVVANAVSPQNYHDTWRAALGINYRMNDKILLRCGGGYDQSPTNNVDGDVRLPDVDRVALSIGAHYQMKPSIGFDAGYTHFLAYKSVYINRVDQLTADSSYYIRATGKPSADLVGLQAVWTIDDPTLAATK